MKFSLFRKDSSKEAQLEAQAQLEKLLVESFRSLGQLFTKAAELIEAQRLEKKGYREQGRFLERVDVAKSPPEKS